MPVHWFTRPGSIEEVFGAPISRYEVPAAHPDSFATSMTYDPADGGELGVFPDPATETLLASPSDARVHYHHGLHAGEHTLAMHLMRLVLRHVASDAGYAADGFLADFQRFLTTPGAHPDFTRDVFIRRWFERRSRGMPLAERAVPQREVWSVGSMGGLLGAIPVLLLAAAHHADDDDAAAAIDDAVRHHRLTHNSENVEAAFRVLAPLLLQLVRRRVPASDAEREADAAAVRRAIIDAAGKLHLPVTDGPGLLRRYNEYRGPSNTPKPLMYELHTKLKPEPFDLEPELAKPVAKVVGRQGFLSTACYTEHAFPGVLYLAAKFPEFGDAVMASANALGDSTSRGSVLGAVLGAAWGTAGLPAALVGGLRHREAIEAEIDAFLDRAFAAAHPSPA